MERLLLIPLCFLVFSCSVTRQDNNSIQVSTFLHGTATLRCSFGFINGPEGLFVSWVKKQPDKVVHSYHDGADDLTDQDVQFQHRTKMSISFYKGNVDLTLNNVGFEDEGIYSCGASNKMGHGEVYFRIYIDRLHGEDPVVLVVDGKKQLKCSSVGFYEDAEIIWQNKELEDLSRPETPTSRTLQPDGRLLLESTLDIDVKPNVHYFCRVKEGRLRRSTRAVLSDGEHSINMRNEF
uniref:Ig-like domain-containing protein n=1 Tax=Leptobrachium leishanense TaxID=445787 RepID=A0A8C5LS39_9ANUR